MGIFQKWAEFKANRREKRIKANIELIRRDKVNKDERMAAIEFFCEFEEVETLIAESKLLPLISMDCAAEWLNSSTSPNDKTVVLTLICADGVGLELLASSLPLQLINNENVKKKTINMRKKLKSNLIIKLFWLIITAI